MIRVDYEQAKSFQQQRSSLIIVGLFELGSSLAITIRVCRWKGVTLGDTLTIPPPPPPWCVRLSPIGLAWYNLLLLLR